jgi:hypothetical protein
MMARNAHRKPVETITLRLPVAATLDLIPYSTALYRRLGWAS